MREQVNTVVDAVTRLGEQVSTERAASKAERAALERSAVKGQDYEELVAQTVTNLAATSGDDAEAVGRTSGSSGTRIGDIVVDIDPSLSGGASARYVLECKDRRLSLKALLAELRGAATNRDAQAAVAVISAPPTRRSPSRSRCSTTSRSSRSTKTNPTPLRSGSH